MSLQLLQYSDRGWEIKAILAFCQEWNITRVIVKAFHCKALRVKIKAFHHQHQLGSVQLVERTQTSHRYRKIC